MSIPRLAIHRPVTMFMISFINIFFRSDTHHEVRPVHVDSDDFADQNNLEALLIYGMSGGNPVINWTEPVNALSVNANTVVLAGPHAFLRQLVVGAALLILLGHRRGWSRGGVMKLQHLDDWIIVLELPKRRAFMHLDTVMTMVDQDKFTVYPFLWSQKAHHDLTATTRNPAPITELFALQNDQGPCLECFNSGLAVHDADYVRYLKTVCEATPPDRSVYPYVFPIRNAARPPKDLAVRAVGLDHGFSGRLIDRTGHYRTYPVLGCALAIPASAQALPEWSKRPTISKKIGAFNGDPAWL